MSADQLRTAMLQAKARYLLLLLICFKTAAFSQPLRIACIGTRFTFGEGIVNRERNSYPVQLQALLGKGYQVTNYGLSQSDTVPASRNGAIEKAIRSAPHIVFIECSAPADSILIDRFRKEGSSFRIVLLPSPNSLLAPIQEIAFQKNCEILNLYMLFSGHPELIPDSVHLSSLGAGLIARRLYETVIQKKGTAIPLKFILPSPMSSGNFYGYRMAEFRFRNRDSKVVFPKRIAPGAPWIWRARFWGHEPQTDIALLERGFHVVYCDVAELFGNPEAIAHWNAFYRLLRKGGLGPKAVLEGMSRGGVYIYNWAHANPDKVAAIYADAPVLDLKSWPGGKGKGPGSKADWEVFLKDYHLDENTAAGFHNSPLDKAEAIARLQLPLIHVVGDADDIVPVDENTGPFEARIKAKGGSITVIHKPGIGHHPHSLADPSPIVDFILRATGRKINFATLPAPGNEYRSAAGWTAGTDWWQQHRDIDSLLAARQKTDIIFLGNSITQGIAGDRPHVTYKPGLEAFTATFAGYSWIAAGISGDRTQHVLWRLQQGQYKKAAPRFLVLTIGVNNYPDQSAAETADGIRSILHWLQQHLPKTKVILIGPLPAGNTATEDRRLFYNAVQDRIRLIRQPGVIYLPMDKYFIRPDGSLDPDSYSSDGIHLLGKGYAVWAGALKTMILTLDQ